MKEPSALHGENKLLGNVQDMDLQGNKKLKWKYSNSLKCLKRTYAMMHRLIFL